MKWTTLIAVTISSFYAPIVKAGAGWTDYVSVAEIVATSRHYYEVRLLVKKNPSDCKEDNWFYQDYDARGADEMFMTLMEAIKTGLNVRVYVTGKCNLNGYSEISSVSIVR